MAVCATVAQELQGSHATLDALFEAAGAPGPPPDLSHETKWKTWLFRAGKQSFYEWQDNVLFHEEMTDEEHRSMRDKMFGLECSE
jgi:hypothetical protein